MKCSLLITQRHSPFTHTILIVLRIKPFSIECSNCWSTETSIDFWILGMAHGSSSIHVLHYYYFRFIFFFVLFDNNNWLLFKYFIHLLHPHHQWNENVFFGFIQLRPVFNIFFNILGTGQTKMGKSWDFWLADLWLQFISQIHKASNYSNHFDQITTGKKPVSTPVSHIFFLYSESIMDWFERARKKKGDFIFKHSRLNNILQ